MKRKGAKLKLPVWAIASKKRREHIARVTALIDSWAKAMRVGKIEARAWHDAALLHDAYRDADEDVLREWSGDSKRAAELLHGPATAERLEQEGEKRRDVLSAIRYHTVGNAAWSRTGRALYMADFLEPGRRFSRRDRAFLAEQVPSNFDGVFQQVVRAKLAWSLHEGHSLFPETVALWNSFR